MLAIDADLDITIDGRSARLSGSGRRLTLELASAATVRDFLRVSLPDLGGGTISVRDVPELLVSQGLTVEVRDQRGPLFVVGAEAEGERIRLPLVGRLVHVKLAGKSALLRLAVST